MAMILQHRPCPKLLVLFLALSFLLSSSSAVPATRLVKSENEIPTQFQEFVAQEAMGISDSGELYEGRMDMESTDYPGAGANNHHDPKAPGRA